MAADCPGLSVRAELGPSDDARRLLAEHAERRVVAPVSRTREWRRILMLCLFRFWSAGLPDVFDEVSRYGENRNRVLPEREDYEVTLDGIPIGNNFLVPAVSVRDSVVRSHVGTTFGH